MVKAAAAVVVLALSVLTASTVYAVDPVVLSTATPTIQLSRGTGFSGTTPMNIEYHPGFNQYYGANGGNPSFTGWVWDASGNILQAQSPIGVSVRAFNLNPSTGELEVCTFSANVGGANQGLFAMGLTGAGLFTGAFTTRLAAVPGLIDAQCMPAFDPARNRLYSHSSSATINVADRASGALLTTITLDLAPVGSPTLTTNGLGFDSAYDMFITLDPAGSRVLVHRLNGSFFGASTLSGFAVPTSFSYGYSNGQVFIFDSAANAWRGFRIFAPSTAATNTAPRQFSLSSFPLHVTDNAINTLVIPQTGAPDTSVWRLGTWNPAQASYLHAHPAYASIGRELTEIEVGKGYWFITNAAGSLQQTGYPGENAVDVPLLSGSGGSPQFNQLGNPFLGASLPVSLLQVRLGATVRSLTDAANTFTDQVIWSWTGTSYSPLGAGGSIPASAGFWLRKVSSGAVRLIMKAGVSSAPNEANEPLATVHQSHWDLTITARRDGLEATPITVGEAAGAAGEWNPLSYGMPPPALGGGVRLVLMRNDWGELSGEYASEYQPPADRMTWDIAVDRSDGPGQIELGFAGRDLPDGMRFALTDVASGVTWDVTPGTPVLLASGRERELKLTATRQGGAPAATPRTSFSAYPNPFVDRTGFVITGAPTGRLRVAIYDLSGRRVRQLEQHGAGTGEQVMIWDGRDDDGSPVRSGVYFARNEELAGAPMVRVVRVK